MVYSWALQGNLNDPCWISLKMRVIHTPFLSGHCDEGVCTQNFLGYPSDGLIRNTQDKLLRVRLVSNNESTNRNRSRSSVCAVLTCGKKACSKNREKEEF